MELVGLADRCAGGAAIAGGRRTGTREGTACRDPPTSGAKGAGVALGGAETGSSGVGKEAVGSGSWVVTGAEAEGARASGALRGAAIARLTPPMASRSAAP